MSYLSVVIVRRGRPGRELVGIRVEVGLRRPLALLGRGGRRGGGPAAPRLGRARARARLRARSRPARRAVDHLHRRTIRPSHPISRLFASRVLHPYGY